MKKDQCAQDALALDNKGGPRLGLDWIEGEIEIQPAELGLDLCGVGLEQGDQILQLLMNHGESSGTFVAAGFGSSRFN